MTERPTAGAKVHTYSYSITVVIDALDEASAKIAQSELRGLVHFAADTTERVAGPDTDHEWVPVHICADNNNDWELVEIRDPYTEDDDDC